jgi:hypothetical protein
MKTMKTMNSILRYFLMFLDNIMLKAVNIKDI